MRRPSNAMSFGCRGLCSEGRTWIPETREEMEKIVVTAHTATLEEKHHESAKEVVPWFFREMPNAYFNVISEEARMRHLRALTALRDAGAAPELMIHNKSNSEVTFIQPREGFEGGGGGGKESGNMALEATTATNLLKMLQELPAEAAQLARVHLFSARDATLSLNVFDYSQQERFSLQQASEKEAMQNLHQYCADLKAGTVKAGTVHAEWAEYLEPGRLEAYCRLGCSKAYVERSNVRRFVLQRALFEQVSGRDGVACQVEDWEVTATPNDKMITVASANVLPKSHLQKMMTYLTMHEMTIGRAHLDVVEDDGEEGGTVSMIRLLVQKHAMDAEQTDWDAVAQDICRLKWLDDDELQLAKAMQKVGSSDTDDVTANNPLLDSLGGKLGASGVPLRRAEVVQALSHMVFGVLYKVNPYAYSRTRIFEVLQQPVNLSIAMKIASLFIEKFDPDARGGARMDSDRYDAVAEEIHRIIQTKVEHDDAQLLLTTLLQAVGSTLRTNFFCDKRFALALRVDPSLLGVNEDIGTDTPYGTLFVHGRRFNGFHVRFRDIARGGLRVVLPASKEQHTVESARQYDEVYSLAFAQQLKNKDIPEGGSKAVVLVDPAFQGTSQEEVSGNFKDYLMRKSVKAFSDSVLDLVTSDQDVKDRIVDYYGRDELIYLGPDENVIPEDINWIIDRAGKRGYPIPAAFMSSKPDAGINHKVYGVTSEGVAVFLDTALKQTGMHPDDTGGTFTVKITGGPDGDVAGNMMKILHREYGPDKCKIVGICDGSGAAEDPNGLCMDELLRMFHAVEPIASFSPSKLSADGVVYDVSTPEGVRRRNDMHNRVVADVFVPAGGRPATINETNYQQYLLDDGTPSSPLIVEGANLFVTPAARQALFDEAGVVIVKDSSANKCGVITSSYEIMASMMLSAEEFMGIKDELVEQVLEKLRSLARVEAELMFREYKLDPSAALPPHSQRISHAITRVHDSISQCLGTLDAAERDEVLSMLVAEHLPPKLLEASGKDGVRAKVPPAYLAEIVACGLASKIVYREGISFIEGLPEASEVLAEIGFKYLKQEQRVKELVNKVEESKMNSESKAEIIDLLYRGGIRAGVEQK